MSGAFDEAAIGGSIHQSPANRNILIGTIVVTWVIAVTAGLGFLVQYATSAGQFTAAPERIAAESGKAAAEHRLFMFVHPHCPCSAASVNELAKVMSRCEENLQATVYFIRPESRPRGWERGALWNLAKSIPGVNVETDDGGRKFNQFHANTSGETFVYDRAGQLCFQGGITAARGHAGDNRGESTVIAIALGEDFHAERTPVFGCPLRDKAAVAGR
jgi:hypothetical protein